MEFFNELFVTAFVTVVLAVLAFKLVSMVVCVDFGCDSSRSAVREAVIEEVKFDNGGLRVESGRSSKRRVRFVEGFVHTVHRFDDDDRSVRVEESEERLVLEERCDFGEISGRIDEESEVPGLPEKSPEVEFPKEEVSGEIVREVGLEGVNEVNVDAGVDRLVVEETRGGASVADDEFDGVDDQSSVPTSLDAEETIANLASNEEIGEKSRSGIEVGVSKREENVADDESDDQNSVSTRLDDLVVEEISVQTAKSSSDEVSGIEVGVRTGEELDFDEDDDWEGIERSELEKAFAVAANYVGVGSGEDDRLENMGSDVQMQLYGLHKVAIEGPCHEPQPMALKLTARAKWNAWQQLGNMNPEAAMEQYITLLSDNVPGWTERGSSEECKQDYSEAGTSDMSKFLQKQQHSEEESKLDLKCGIDY